MIFDLILKTWSFFYNQKVCVCISPFSMCVWKERKRDEAHLCWFDVGENPHSPIPQRSHYTRTHTRIHTDTDTIFNHCLQISAARCPPQFGCQNNMSGDIWHAQHYSLTEADSFINGQICSHLTPLLLLSSYVTFLCTKPQNFILL